MRQIAVRDPGAALTAEDLLNRLPHQTKRRTRRTRGFRSLAAAVAAIASSVGSDEPFPSERFCDVTWTPVFGSGSANKAIHPAEQFFRFSAFRYVIDEARKNARVNSEVLAEELLGSADAKYLLNRYYYDCPREELPDLGVCSAAASAAFRNGWLPYLTADWLVDDGAYAVLQLINLHVEKLEEGDGTSTCTAEGLGKTSEELENVLGESRSRRLDIGVRARAAMKALKRLYLTLDAALGESPGSALRACKRRTSTSAAAKSAAKSLSGLAVALETCGREIRWEVRASSSDFLRELAGLVSDVVTAPEARDLQERTRAFGHVLSTLHTGISMTDLARRLGGGNFFDLIEASGTDEEINQVVDFEEVVIVELDLEEYAQRRRASEEWERSEFGKVGDLDIWVSTPWSKLIAAPQISIDSSRRRLQTTLRRRSRGHKFGTAGGALQSVWVGGSRLK